MPGFFTAIQLGQDFFLTSAAEKTKTQAKNSRSPLPKWCYKKTCLTALGQSLDENEN